MSAAQRQAVRPVGVTSNGRTIQQILTAGFYKVPRFQRPYSWDRAVVDDFWRDLVDNRPGYFIGSMVVYTDADAWGLIDGQQRLTTITILLAVLRNEFLTLGLEDKAAGLQTLIERRDLANKLRFVLQTESSYPFLQGQIQAEPGTTLAAAAARPEEKTLEEAFAYLSTRVRSELQGIDEDSKISAKRKAKQHAARLADLRDRVLSLTLVLVEVDDEDDATVIFQTMNSRGKDLEPADLVKSHLFALLKPQNPAFDQVRDQWSRIVNLFAESAADVTMNRFLLHSWLSRHDYVGEKGLFKAVRLYARRPPNARDYLANLATDSESYRAAQEPSYWKWTKAQAELQHALEALNLFRLRQPLPMVLALLRDLKSGALRPRIVLRGLRTIENFHFIYTAVANQPSSGGVSGMYALAARQLLGATNPTSKSAVIGDLAAKLRARLPSYAEFEASFMELHSSRTYTQQTPLVRYILGRLRIAAAPRGVNVGELNIDALTIEHLAPQGSRRPAGLSDEDVAKVGNLLMVTEALNQALEDKAFPAKLKILASRRVSLESEVQTATTWTASEIDARTKRLATRAYNEVWRL